jgi:hypothetical protein
LVQISGLIYFRLRPEIDDFGLGGVSEWGICWKAVLLF